MERTKDDAAFAADSLHALLTRKMPGADEAPGPSDREAFAELEYAGELMLVQFLALVRSALTAKPKAGGRR